MLLKLPLDLLIEIASYLSFSQKLQLVLTCKKIKVVILERCLFETFEFNGGKEKTETVVLNFRKNPSYGQQVKVLRINLNLLSNQLFAEVPSIFPNVVNFKDYGHHEPTRSAEACCGYIQWNKTIKYLEDGRDEETGVIFKSLQMNVFPCLTNITVSPLKFGEDDINLLECVNNAPVLETLHLRDHIITLEEIEILHSRSSRLTTFTMSDSVIIVNQDKPLPKRIKPVLRLSCFRLIKTAILDQHCVFLDYITRKYTKLIKLELAPSFFERALEIFSPGQNYWELRSNADHNARRNELSVTREKYSASASEILSNLPSTLKILQTTKFDIRDPAAIFSKKCVNLTHIDFFGDSRAYGCVFKSPEDINMFRNLPFLKRLSMLIDPSVQEWKQAPVSTSVTELEVIVKGLTIWNDMDVGWLLSIFPSLNTLTILASGSRLIGYESNPPKLHPNLTRLLIGPSTIHSDLWSFISSAAPNLKNLSYCIFGKSLKERIEKNSSSQFIVVHPITPEIKNDKSHYAINLTGFSLDSFELEIDLREKAQDKRGDVILELKKKDGKSAQFVIFRDFKAAYFAGYDNKNLDQQIKTIITVQYDYIKRMFISEEITIDLETSQVQLKYRN